MVDINLLRSLYEVNSKSGKEDAIKSFIDAEIEAYNQAHEDNPVKIEQDVFGNMYFTKGTEGDSDYPCFVAHLDEVHEDCTRNIIVDGNIIYGMDEEGERCGIGADDKNGIYICLKLLTDYHIGILKVAFFREEEVGLVGSAHSRLEFFEDCKYVIQPDGPCNHEFCVRGYYKKAYHELSKVSFWKPYLSILDRHQFYVADGGATDVVMLRQRTLDVPCAEISAGYYSYHKKREFTVLSELDNSYKTCLELIEASR